MFLFFYIKGPSGGHSSWVAGTDKKMSISPSPWSSAHLLFHCPFIPLQTQTPSSDSANVFSRVGRAENREEKGVISEMSYKLSTLPALWGLWVSQPAVNPGDRVPELSSLPLTFLFADFLF